MPITITSNLLKALLKSNFDRATQLTENDLVINL